MVFQQELELLLKQAVHTPGGLLDKVKTTLPRSVCYVGKTIPYVKLLMTWYIRLSSHPAAISLFAGVTAGIFEEAERFITMKFFLKKQRKVDGIAFGLGHGGIEAMLLIGTNLLFFLFCILILRYESADALANMLGEPLASQIISSVKNVTALTAFIAGFERISALGLHIGFSLIVLYGFNKKKPVRYLLTAILLHSIIDASIGIIPLLGINTIGLEIFVLIYSVLVLLTALYLWKKLKINTETNSF